MLYFTIGLPRCGKSTWANKWVRFEADIEKCDKYEGHLQFCNRPHDFRRLRFDENPRAVVNEDAIRFAVTGKRFTFKVEPIAEAITHAMISSYVAQGYDVLVDETHTTWKSIEALLWIDPNAKPIWIYRPKYEVETDYSSQWPEIVDDGWKAHVELCCQRALETNQQDLVDVIKYRHAIQIEQLVYKFNEEFQDRAQYALENKQ